MSPTLTAAQAVPCPRCGGVFALAALANEVRCPFCAHGFALGPERLQELARYQARVQALLGSANVEYQAAANWDWFEQTGRRGGPLTALAIVGAVSVITMAFGWFVTRSGVVPEEYGPLAIVGFVVVAGFGITLAAVLIGGTLQEAQRARPGVKRVACPSCGAPNELHAGQSLETCRFCRAALVPAGAAIAGAVSHVEAAVRAAQLARFRAERRGSAALNNASSDRYLHYVLVGSLLPMTLGGAIFTLVQLVREPASADLGAVVALHGLAALNFAPMVAFYARERAIRRRWAAVLGDLAAQFRGRMLEGGVRGLVEWLNAYWAAPYELSHLRSSLLQTSVGLDACGYPALVDVDPARAIKTRKPRVHVVVAAAVPEAVAARQAPLPPAAEAGCSWLAAAGFEVRLTRSGLLAIARPATVERLRRAPESAHMLSTVITTLAGVARAIRAAPVGSA
jgi:hypothetical protein